MQLKLKIILHYLSYMLDTIDEKLLEDMIKKYHFILKDGTLTDSEKMV